MKPLEQLQNWWKSATPVLRAVVLTGALGAVVSAVVLGSRPTDVAYAPLFTQLDAKDAGAIAELLRQKKVAYRLEAGGSAILVPVESVDQLRIEMASAELPRGGGVGFEIFDKNPLFSNDFTNRLNRQRALQGTLARTFEKIPEVESANVILNLPENTLFTKDRHDPTASVSLRLRPGRTLSEGQVAGVIHLVSSAVENLSPERVSVVDGTGRMLSAPPATDEASASARAQGLTHEYESRMERRLVELLEPLVGPGKVIARVSADMDLSQVEATEETFDGDNATVQREQKLTETANQQTQTTGGVAGTPGNLPQTVSPAGPNNGGSNNNSNRNTVQVDYAIPRVVKHVKRPVGSLRRLSVALVLDSRLSEEEAAAGAAGADAGTGPETSLPRVAQRPALAGIDELVKKAVGFDAARGDQLEVLYTPFASVPDHTLAAAAAVAPPAAESLPLKYLAGAGGGLLLLGVVGTYLLLSSKKKKRALLEARVAAEAAHAPEASAKEKEDEEPAPATLEEQVREHGRQNIPLTTKMIREWLAESGRG